MDLLHEIADAYVTLAARRRLGARHVRRRHARHAGRSRPAGAATSTTWARTGPARCPVGSTHVPVLPPWRPSYWPSQRWAVPDVDAGDRGDARDRRRPGARARRRRGDRRADREPLRRAGDRATYSRRSRERRSNRDAAGRRAAQEFHFVFGLRPQVEPMHIVHWLALESCRRTQDADAIHLHLRHLPHGPVVGPHRAAPHDPPRRRRAARLRSVALRRDERRDA